MAKRKKKGKMPAAPAAKDRPAKRVPIPPIPVKSFAAEPANASAQPPQQKPDYAFWAAIGFVIIAAAGMLFLSLSGTGEQQSAPLKSAPSQPQPPQIMQPAAPSVKVTSSTYDNAYFRGNASADIIIAEYSDFQCPYCGEALGALSQVKQAYPGVKIAYRHYPISTHPDSQKAAEAAECAGAQGKFWEMHSKIFENQGSLSISSLKGYAAVLGLDAAAFNSCLDSGKTAPAVASQAAEAASLGISATPSFLVFSKRGAGNKILEANVNAEAQSLAARYSQYSLPVGAVNVEGAGYGIVFAGALPFSDFAEVLAVFGEKQAAQ